MMIKAPIWLSILSTVVSLAHIYNLIVSGSVYIEILAPTSLSLKFIVIIWRSWVWTSVGSNLAHMVLLSKSYLNQTIPCAGWWTKTGCWPWIITTCCCSRSTPASYNTACTDWKYDQHCILRLKIWSPRETHQGVDSVKHNTNIIFYNPWIRY